MGTSHALLVPADLLCLYYVYKLNGGNCQTNFLSESCAKLVLLCLFNGDLSHRLFIYLQNYLKAKSNNVFGRYFKSMFAIEEVSPSLKKLNSNDRANN